MAVKSKDRIVYLMNTADTYKPFVIHDVSSVRDALQKILDINPKLGNEMIGLSLRCTRGGPLLNEKDSLPEDAENIYVTLFLRKH